MSETLISAPNGPLTPGGKYRVVLSIRAPYTIENIENLEARWNVVSGLNARFDVDTFRVSYPVNGVWKCTVDFTVAHDATANGTGIFLLDSIGKIAQDTVSFIIGAGALILTTVQKFVVGTVSGVGDAVTKPLKEVLNPGVLILAVVGIFLVVRR